ncbi:hypothetical protein A1O7_05913 [Cladophialophora yegresii CBS 114405]|uniref:Uncharacterized protein n=1 Tax=Cladophialophora yegresii CBS 114405 TaxID=1182544 RepID=W9VRZ2_9EURO|nr:uncharacterized protein A1O7_05913 [Cladophialophora yegresii CBS 114405]EXJ58487.1 hypothetical protein A1O7_05913 [Cladophialophora yegresii CBS 114405]
MRLLSTRTEKIKEFYGDVPDYAILSHTWEKEEVLFQDLFTGNHRWKRGWDKVRNCCKVAARDGWDWIWIDTCCIDKSSSVELSEAINSMFRWYAEACVCYAYLSGPSSQRFAYRKWWTRGWTLQELLAPKHVVFLDEAWNVLGTRTSLGDEIARACGITGDDIHDFKMNRASIARRMHWASERETTRLEDEAYCLLGIFGVHMPLLYGEGKAAFRRLQSEIMKVSDDESIFAWTHLEDGKDCESLLAPEVRCFSKSQYYRPRPNHALRPVFEVTKRGVSMLVTLYEVLQRRPCRGKRPPPNRKLYLAPLNCIEENRKSLLALVLREVGPNLFVRDKYEPVRVIGNLERYTKGWDKVEKVVALIDRRVEIASRESHGCIRLKITSSYFIELASMAASWNTAVQGGIRSYALDYGASWEYGAERSSANHGWIYCGCGKKCACAQHPQQFLITCRYRRAFWAYPQRFTILADRNWRDGIPEISLSLLGGHQTAAYESGSHPGLKSPSRTFFKFYLGHGVRAVAQWRPVPKDDFFPSPVPYMNLHIAEDNHRWTSSPYGLFLWVRRSMTMLRRQESVTFKDILTPVNIKELFQREHFHRELVFFGLCVMAGIGVPGLILFAIYPPLWSLWVSDAVLIWRNGVDLSRSRRWSIGTCWWPPITAACLLVWLRQHMQMLRYFPYLKKWLFVFLVLRYSANLAELLQLGIAKLNDAGAWARLRESIPPIAIVVQLVAFALSFWHAQYITANAVRWERGDQ